MIDLARPLSITIKGIPHPVTETTYKLIKRSEELLARVDKNEARRMTETNRERPGRRTS